MRVAVVLLTVIGMRYVPHPLHHHRQCCFAVEDELCFDFALLTPIFFFLCELSRIEETCLKLFYFFLQAR